MDARDAEYRIHPIGAQEMREIHAGADVHGPPYALACRRARLRATAVLARTTVTTTTISTTEIAAMAGSMLSRSPIHISRGSVTASTEVMKSVTPIPSHDSTK